MWCFPRNNNTVLPRAWVVFNNVWYHWSGWLGCQLESFEWFKPPAGTRRVLDFTDGTQPIEITVFTTKRDRFKVRCTWSVASHGTHDEHVARITDLNARLKKLI